VATQTDAGSIASRPLAIILVARTSLNTAHRIIYPFLPAIARGLGISLASASMLISLRLAAGLVAPLLGPASDRFGRRRVMELALLLFSLGGLLLAIGSPLITAAAALVLFGLAKVLYDPAAHGYLGDTIPYVRRARAVGLIELSWSAAWLIGVPSAGFLIDQLGWRAPWAVLCGLGLLSLALTRAGLPATGKAGARPDRGQPLTTTWRQLLSQPAVRILLATSFFLVLALELPFIIYGAWLETSFGLGLTSLGLASIVIGLSEAAAELGVTTLTDRLGKRRSIVIGTLGLAASLVAWPWLARWGLVPALAGLAAVMVSFEFAIVSLIPLATEVAPGSRATLLSLNLAAFSLGRIVGSTAGGWLWQLRPEQITYHAVAGAVCALVAASLMGAGLRRARLATR
jgi:predicted MFS family arabinose efflux permease